MCYALLPFITLSESMLMELQTLSTEHVKRAIAANRPRFFAMLFSDPDDQGMIFIIQPGVRRQVFHEELLHRGIVGISFYQPNPAEDPLGIGISHKKRLFARVQ